MTSSVRYRNFLIRPTAASYHKDHDFTWSHVDYDPTPEHSYDGPSDNRIGTASSIEGCKAQIDEWHMENV